MSTGRPSTRTPFHQLSVIKSALLQLFNERRHRRTLSRRIRHDIRHLSLRRVLAKCPQQVAQHLARHRASALLVEQRERLLVLCKTLRAAGGRAYISSSASATDAITAVAPAYLRYRSVRLGQLTGAALRTQCKLTMM